MFRTIATSAGLAGSCFALWTFYSDKTQASSNVTTNEIIQNTKTFIWGNGVYQPRPDAALRFKNYEPKLIKTFMGKDGINLKDITFGDNHEGGIDINNNIHVWKSHKLDSSYSKGDNERSEILVLDEGGDNKQMAFAMGFIWILKENGDVYQHTILDEKQYKVQLPIEVEIIKTPQKVDELKGIVQISSGEGHFAALDKNGHVWVVGDDTLGQCGQGAQMRNSAPPFFQKEYKKPVKVANLTNITKIACGANHTIAVNRDGVVFGWGSNSNIQLSHHLEFSQPENPLLAVFSPIRIEKNLGPIVITDIAAGDEFSIFVGRNRFSSETEVYACGHNLHGELGLGGLSHIQEVTKIQSLSNYKVTSEEEGQQDVTIDKLSCGSGHCMALLNIGAVLIWGGNEHGQLGNKKRVFSENPGVVKELADEKVLNICCKHRNSAAICEHKL